MIKIIEAKNMYHTFNNDKEYRVNGPFFEHQKKVKRKRYMSI